MPKIWQYGKNIVTLHSQSGNDDTERKQNLGAVVQPG